MERDGELKNILIARGVQEALYTLFYLYTLGLEDFLLIFIKLVFNFRRENF